HMLREVPHVLKMETSPSLGSSRAGAVLSSGSSRAGAESSNERGAQLSSSGRGLTSSGRSRGNGLSTYPSGVMSSGRSSGSTNGAASPSHPQHGSINKSSSQRDVHSNGGPYRRGMRSER
ncbi:unnamed protein product, partial [Polarella glacialis]